MDVGVDSRGECMVEERHYVEEPAFILNRGICGRHARNGRGYRMSVTIESFALDKIQSSVVVKLFASLLIGRYQTQCVAGGVFFPGRAV